jgi:hypothetical protein
MMRLVRAVYQDLALKLIAILCACALWIYVEAVSSEVATLAVAPTFVGADGRPVDAVALDGRGLPSSVLVTVRGARERVRLLSADALECTLRLPAHDGDAPVVVPIDRECVSLGDAVGLTVRRVEPAQVTVRGRAAPEAEPGGGGDQ